jgi:hypothetical protein
MENLIAKQDAIEVYWSAHSMTVNKGVRVQVTAINPVNGKEYTRGVGWISCKMCLHYYANAPLYILEEGKKIKLTNELKAAIVSYLKANGFETRAKDFEGSTLTT